MHRGVKQKRKEVRKSGTDKKAHLQPKPAATTTTTPTRQGQVLPNPSQDTATN